jgi:hypothetical protein
VSSPPADLAAGAAVGVGVALSLASLLLVAQVTGLSPLPAPLGVAFAKTVLPSGTAGPHGLLWIGLGLHVVYVGSATVGYLAVARDRASAVSALGWAAGLWVVAGIVFAPLVGWGWFAAGLGVGGFVNLLAVHAAFGCFVWVGAQVLYWRGGHAVPAALAGHVGAVAGAQR